MCSHGVSPLVGEWTLREIGPGWRARPLLGEHHRNAQRRRGGEGRSDARRLGGDDGVTGSDGLGQPGADVAHECDVDPVVQEAVHHDEVAGHPALGANG
jgi:hypothetical protein